MSKVDSIVGLGSVWGRGTRIQHRKNSTGKDQPVK